ncbi:MAG TPA: hypothetical protein VG796_06795 [Verrucomicrobiales bacterium]|jgi:hypothetical protein|nr:hypothetical protein [Verrucomicrobiales bacterium]
MKIVLTVLAALVFCSCGDNQEDIDAKRYALSAQITAAWDDVIAIKERMLKLPPGSSLGIESQALKRAEDKKTALQAELDATFKK